MKAFLIYVLLIVLSPLTLVAQSFRGCDWISCIDESRTVASLSIPGAHDAATGEGLVMIPGFGKTQDLSIAELWDCGVRAFDLRPAVRKGELHVYHSIIRTKVTFSRALEILCSRLEAHPTEFAIVLKKMTAKMLMSRLCGRYLLGKQSVSLAKKQLYSHHL